MFGRFDLLYFLKIQMEHNFLSLVFWLLYLNIKLLNFILMLEFTSKT